MSEIITTLHNSTDTSIDVYPNIKAENIPSHSITNDYLALAAVDTQYITNAAVTAAKIADSAVTTSKLGAYAVTTAKIDDEAVTTAKIDDSAVTTAKIASGAITNDLISNDTIAMDKLNQYVVSSIRTYNYRFSGDLTFNSVTQHIVIEFNVPSYIFTITTTTAMTTGILETFTNISGDGVLSCRVNRTNNSGLDDAVEIYYDDDDDALKVVLMNGSEYDITGVSGTLYVKKISY